MLIKSIFRFGPKRPGLLQFEYRANSVKGFSKYVLNEEKVQLAGRVIFAKTYDDDNFRSMLKSRFTF